MAARYQTPSNIRVAVAFESPIVFAGEDLVCTITFKNIARSPGTDTSPSRSPPYNGTHAERVRKVTPMHLQGRPNAGGRNSVNNLNLPPHMRKGHRPTSSAPTSEAGLSSPALGAAGGSSTPRHGRSLSILSMGTDGGTSASIPNRGGHEGAHRGSKSHERSMSVQSVPRRTSAGKLLVQESGLSSGAASPRIIAPVITEQNMDDVPAGRFKRPGTVRRSPGTMNQEFKFPAGPAGDELASPFDPDSAVSPMTIQLPFKGATPGHADVSANPIARLLSESSASGSPRTSVDYSEAMSNHSDETLMSEYVPQQVVRLLPRPNHKRTNSRLAVREPPRGPETLMMGYVQLAGSFTLEGSLINQAPFEEIKRKGVVGSHGGGGVVGVERTKRDSGLFGSFGWGNIGESLGGLLGGAELSSIKEMRGIANSKSIPLITTPPSILFVDLQLAPGESKSYSYKFTLPRGLPPSHRGRAIKVSYQLAIGTQRRGKGKEQQVRHVDVPFRIFGSVDPSGDILGHDLMSPYILLRDEAKTSLVDPSISKPDIKPKKPPDKHNGVADFMSYTSALLDRSGPNGQPALLSPTTPPATAEHLTSTRRLSSVGEAPQTQLDIIDLAILRSNHSDHKPTNGSTTLSNKFDIARSGQLVATLHITRPAYRLGETINLVADFKGASIPTYAIQVALETRETVDAAIAMRSSASVYRYTRKVHAYDAANALFSRRLSFALAIPTNATPDFVTSGISLDWRLRIEFVTPRLWGIGGGVFEEQLLEEVAEDDRGVVLQGVEGLKVESFEVAVPVRIYGGPTSGAVGEWDVQDMPV